MLSISIPETELWDEKNEEFIYVKSQELKLEHSLISVSKWEAKWNKPFFTKNELTTEEAADYIRCMTLNKTIDPYVYTCLTPGQFDEISEYMNRKMTAAWFNEKKGRTKKNGQQVTSDLIYCWMAALHIPFECEKWHLNRLVTLIRVCDEENQPKKKMKPKDVRSRNRALNAARKKRLHTRG